MQVDFYQLTRDPAENLLPAIAQKVMEAGKRLLVISASAQQRGALSKAMWTATPESFLAHGVAGEGDEAKQPILLSDLAEAKNGATYAAIADGQWRDVAGMERVFYLFPPENIDDARAAWRKLGDGEGITRHYWRQDGGRWIEGP